MTECLQELLKFETESSVMFQSQLSQAAKTITTKQPVFKDCSQQLSATVLPDHLMSTSRALNAGSGSEDSSDDDMIPVKQISMESVVPAAAAAASTSQSSPTAAEPAAAAKSAAASVFMKPLPKIPTQVADQRLPAAAVPAVPHPASPAAASSADSVLHVSPPPNNTANDLLTEQQNSDVMQEREHRRPVIPPRPASNSSTSSTSAIFVELHSSLST
jgi:hypothetical protein